MIENSRNAKLRWEYIDYLRHAKAKSENTIASILLSIGLFDTFANSSDYANFNKNKAKGFKVFLAKSKGSGSLSASTIRRHLQNIQQFYQWLYTQSGFKSKLNASDFVYLSPEKGLAPTEPGKRKKRVPSLEYVRSLVSSITGDDEISMRDRALIAFLCLTGIRDDAAASLPIGAVDISSLDFVQDPKLGTRTKFGKYISSHIFPFDKVLLKEVTDWHAYLVKVKLFGDSDPLFPGTQLGQSTDNLSFSATGVSRNFNRSSASIRRILLERSKAAGLDYYFPHSFRHLTTQLLERKCPEIEQMKAVSQTLGHDKLMTTLTSYGTIESNRVGQIIKKINFEIDRTDGADSSDEAIVDDFRAFVKSRKLR